MDQMTLKPKDGRCLSFHLPIIPPKATHHAKRIVRCGKFSRLADKPELVKSKETLISLISPYAPMIPINGPVMLHLDFTFPWRKSEPKRRTALGRVYMTTKPDCSNLVKTLEDVLKDLRFFHDDSQVSRILVTKYWGDNVGISVIVEELDERKS